jgi:prepilin-type N-terminal cleavage/methylation domain-containing protein
VNGPRAHRRRRRAGFTLIEAVATIVILAIIGTASSGIILAASDGFLSASATAQLHTEVSIGLDRICRELRNIQLDTDASGVAPDIDSVTATSITWDDDSSLALNGTNLNLAIGGGASAALLTDVSAFSITTCDEDNAALAASLSGDSCDAVRRIAVSITVTRHGVSETLRAKVFLRSTMLGSES